LVEQRFNLYVLGGAQPDEFAGAVAALGLKVQTLERASDVERPALILLAPGRQAPAGLSDIAISPPEGTPPSALRELIRLASENVALKQDASRSHRQFEELNRIGIALSAERDITKLQGFILLTMRELTNADGASLWLRTEENGAPKLFLASSQNHSLVNTYQAFTVPVDEKSVVGYAVSVGASQIYDDAYNPPPGKPPGGRGFDAQYGYRTKSMLTVPMRNYREEVIGAVQLINAKHNFETKLTLDTVEREVVSFKPEDLPMIESIASQAAVALDNKTLLNDIQKMFEGFVDASVFAIERRDPTTLGHSRNVATLTTGLALAVNEIEVGRYRDFRLNEEQMQVLRYACLLHDFGKVGVPENVLRKAKKLEAGRLELIHMRFEFIQRSRQVKRMSDQIETMRKEGVNEAGIKEMHRQLDEEMSKLRSWYSAIAIANEPSVLPEAEPYITGVLNEISQETYYDMSDVPHPMLEAQEFQFLSIPKGTLDPQERKQIEEHVTHSFKFLSTIPWPGAMGRIPEIAYAHHEKLDGSGYPNHLTGDQISPEARMMAIADIYDALTAHDRPYKKAISTDLALDILHSEAKGGQLDKDLLDVFEKKEVFLATAAR
jgi:HD-GYP domain-containing protein (c-di-GMP phosphodiesterase class II)